MVAVVNRRALLKGLGAAVSALALLPLASLLPKAATLLKGEFIGTIQGFTFRDKISTEDLQHIMMHMDRLMTYGQSTLYISSKPFKVRISEVMHKDPEIKYGRSPLQTTEEEVSKIS